jgi:hypothetical protein
LGRYKIAGQVDCRGTIFVPLQMIIKPKTPAYQNKDTMPNENAADLFK